MLSAPDNRILQQTGQQVNSLPAIAGETKTLLAQTQAGKSAFSG
jgi:hypothetical protein